MRPHAAFRCIAGCSGEHALDQVVYRCPQCNDLLEVVHDLEQLRQKKAHEWIALFEARAARASSGVWSKKEWIAPHIEEREMVSLGEGLTHLLPASRLGRGLGLPALWIKQCGTSHTGSFKDLGMTVLVSQVQRLVARGMRVPAIACASTGDTSAALAAYAAAASLPALVILPRGKVSTAQLLQPLAMGAHVLALDTDFDGCMAVVQRLAAEEGVYLANSMNSLRVEGQKSVALEIAQQLDWRVPDWVVIPGGNLGNVSALYAGFVMLRALGVTDRLPRLAVAQAQKANPLYRAYQSNWTTFEPVVAERTAASAIQIGNPVSVKKAIAALKATQGVVEQASEEELAEAMARADRTGMFTDPHTGVALAALEKLLIRGVISPGERVVVVSTASGLKFVDSKLAYHEGKLPGVPTPGQAARPIELGASYEGVRDTVRSLTRR
jgi:threonine synthase